MKILYVGDIMGQTGRETLGKVLPQIKKELQLDLVIAQAENSNNNGKSPHITDIEEMRAAGADFFTGGNHSFSNTDTKVLYDDWHSNVIRPANVEDMPGEGYKIIQKNGKRILICSILGQIVGGQRLKTVNPLKKIDAILGKEYRQFDIAIVNFHGDYSSEKKVFGYYLDGRVSAVIGDHWHVPTADAMVLPKGTAHISDVGMCGALHSSLGIKTSVIVDRWKSGKQIKNEMELAGPFQFNALYIDIDDQTNFATETRLIQRIIE